MVPPIFMLETDSPQSAVGKRQAVRWRLDADGGRRWKPRIVRPSTFVVRTTGQARRLTRTSQWHQSSIAHRRFWPEGATRRHRRRSHAFSDRDKCSETLKDGVMRCEMEEEFITCVDLFVITSFCDARLIKQRTRPAGGDVNQEGHNRTLIDHLTWFNVEV